MSYLKPSEISQMYKFTLAATKGFHRGDFDKIIKLLHLLSGILVQFLQLFQLGQVLKKSYSKDQTATEEELCQVERIEISIQIFQMIVSLKDFEVVA